jgi:hypothetical protein
MQELDVIKELEVVKTMVYSHIKTIDVKLKFSKTAMLSIYENMHRNIQGCTMEYNVFHSVENLGSSYIELSFPKILFRGEFEEDPEEHNYKIYILFKNRETGEILFNSSIWSDVQKYCREKSISDKLKDVIKTVDSDNLKKLCSLREQYKDNPLIEKVYSQYLLVYNAQKNLKSLLN